MSYGILIDSAAIAGITLNGVDSSVLDFLNNPHMVGFSVLPVFIVPIEKDNIAGSGFVVSILPKPTLLEPVRALHTACKFRDNAGVDISALVSTPRNKAGAPFYTGVEAVPRPVRYTAHIADLRKSDRNDCSVLGVDTVKNGAPHTAVFFGKKLGKLFPLVVIVVLY